MQSEYRAGYLNGEVGKAPLLQTYGRYKGMIGGIGQIGTTPLLAVTDAYPSLI